MKRKAISLWAAALVCAVGPLGWSRDRKPARSALEAYIESVAAAPRAVQGSSVGSLWSPQAPFNDLGRDVRAARVDDVVTIAVFESASAVSSGTTQTQRASSAGATLGLAGRAPRALNPAVNAASSQSLDGKGATTRQTSLQTTVSARVTHVLPNGNLVVEGVRLVGVNSEDQTITLRGIVRPEDLSYDNVVPSERLAMLEVRVNGRGVVGDALRRPHFLYRLLLGVVPF